MPRLIAIRLVQAVPVILIVSVLAFLLINLLPGDPAVVIAGDQASPEAIAAVRHNLGLDRPLLEQLGIWFVHLAARQFRPVADAEPERRVGDGRAACRSRCRSPLLSLAITAPDRHFRRRARGLLSADLDRFAGHDVGAARRVGAGVLDRHPLDHPVQRHSALVSDRRLHCRSCPIQCCGCAR